MRTIGLIGGMSWHSSAHYYRLINEAVADRLGGLHSAPLVMHSVDCEPIRQLQHEDRWSEAGDILADSARRLQVAGAECVVLCTNTMHKLAPAIEAAVSLPLLHIADATANAVKAAGIAKVGLLGTAFTMEQDFYKGRLASRHGLDVVVPDDADRAIVHSIIYDELCSGKILDSSRAEYRRIMQQMVAQGAGGIILGCTEIMMLVGQGDITVPVFDTTTLHALAAAEFALQPG